MSFLLAQIELRDRSGGGDSCVASNGFCPTWISDNLSEYVEPTRRHFELVVSSVALGFAIAFLLALVAHRKRWLVGPITGATGVLYTIPSLALFALLLPITGFGFLPALIALSGYNLLVIFRNVMAGLDNVPAEAKDAALGMGLTENQVLRRVELPLAIPEIVAGLRIATTTTVGLAALAFIAGAGGLGGQILTDPNFKSNIVVAGGLCVVMAVILDLLLVLTERFASPWKRVNA